MPRVILHGGASRASTPRLAVRVRLRASAIALLVLVIVQIYLGALVAGLRAGLIYNTWPLIDGRLIPELSRLLLRAAVVAEFLREHADGAVQSPHGGLCAVAARIAVTWPMPSRTRGAARHGSALVTLASR